MLAIALVAGLFVVFTALRLSRIDGSRFTVCALALSPYGVVVGAMLGALALTLEQWGAGGIVLASTVALTATVLPRAIPVARTEVTGRRVRVLSSNLYQGRADVKTVVALLHEHQVDILSLLELTPEAVEDFVQAGLHEVLPHRIVQPVSGGAGSGLISRYPLVQLGLVGPGRFAQPSARVDLGGAAVEVVAVHTAPPTDSSTVWRAELAGLPTPRADRAIRLLAGDFNATADHAAFRRLLRAGYLDAAERRGAGLRSTWPARLFPPPVTLDHILVDDRATITDYRVFEIPGSDHKAVYGEFVVPDGSDL
jgi:endonuclease/exonuclease/phosphatase (EEP) superfamily protein YafD